MIKAVATNETMLFSWKYCYKSQNTINQSVFVPLGYIFEEKDEKATICGVNMVKMWINNDCKNDN